MNAAVLLALLSAAAPKLDAASAQLLTGVIGAAASANTAFNVVTAEDLRRTLDVEAERRMAGCDAGANSCLAEVASALGASLVLYGDVGVFGDELLLNLNIYESSVGAAGGRRALRAGDPSSLADKAERATQEMLAQYQAAHPLAPGARVTLLVLDIKLRADPPPAAATASAAPDDGAPMPWLLVGAGAAGLTGGAAVAVAILLDNLATSSREKANDPKTDQVEAQRQIDQSWMLGAPAIVLYVAGPALLVGGAALAAVHFVGGE